MVPPSKFAYVAKQLCDMGCYEISLGDTIGVVTSGTVIQLFEAILYGVPIDKLAVHFHDTYGQALSNILAFLQMRGSTLWTHRFQVLEVIHLILSFIRKCCH
ncbi:hypothetical protein SLEP1_g19346 [Rubroshorea leprosula]|nr:hypothetical protein SLEP1_g19346 [Rubroshorea leprosula]